MKEKTKGGARQGAGRKKSEKERVNVQFRMNKDDIEILKIHAELLNERTNKYLEELIKRQEWLFYSHKLEANERMKSEEEQKRIIEDIKKSITKNAKI